MEQDSLIKIGHLNKTFGLKGHIRAFIEPGILSRLKKLEVIFLNKQNNLLPFFTDEADLDPSGHCMLHFEEVKDKTTADGLVRKEIFIDEKYLKKLKPYQRLADFIGFKLSDEKYGELGILENIIELPQHELGQFIYNKKEILFPWIKEIVLRIDKRKKEIRVLLPEGLMDVYL
ncbi:MAG: 16S rRNA processing protein RimM [Chitinophagales bacterium]|nr:16S rRNA processing protein RimM [Chitinophagales bacterium]